MGLRQLNLSSGHEIYTELTCNRITKYTFYFPNMAMEQILIYKAGEGQHKKYVHITISYVIIFQAYTNSNKKNFD
jgi:hypothetical protein